MKFHKDVKSPKETVLRKKRIVSELQKRGEVNKGDSSRETKREIGEIECQRNQ